MIRNYDKLIFEISKPGRKAYNLPPLDVEAMDITSLIPLDFINQEDLLLPEVNEIDVVRHYTNLSMKNYGLINASISASNILLFFISNPCSLLS